MVPDPEKAAETAMKYFHEGYNCAQSVVMAFSDFLGYDPETLSRLMSGFGGGMGRMREVCGAFSAMTFIAGVMRPAADPKDKSSRTACYALVQEMAEDFRKVNGGSIVCRELLGLQPRKESPIPSDRTPEYYSKRPCGQIVGNAARIIAEKLSSSRH